MKDARFLLTNLLVPGLLLVGLLVLTLWPRTPVLQAPPSVLLLRLQDAAQTQSVIDMLQRENLGPIYSNLSVRVGISNFYSLDLVPIDEIRALPANDPRQTPYLQHILSDFPENEPRVFVNLGSDPGLGLQRIRELQRQYAEQGVDLPWSAVGVENRKWLELAGSLCAGLALLILLLPRERGGLVGILAGLSAIAAGFWSTSVGLAFSLPLALLWGIGYSGFAAQLASELERGVWFRHRRDRGITGPVIWKTVAALPKLWKLSFGLGLVMHLAMIFVHLGAGHGLWMPWATSIWMGPAAALLFYGRALWSMRRREHPAFTYSPLVRLRRFQPRQVAAGVLFLAALAFVYPRAGEVLPQLEEVELRATYQEAGRHYYFQTWFAFGAEYPLSDESEPIDIHRYPRNSDGFAYRVQHVDGYGQWLATWTPPPASFAALLWELSRSGLRVVSPQNLGVYSTPEQSYGLRLALILSLIASVVPLLQGFVPGRRRGLPVLRRSETRS